MPADARFEAKNLLSELIDRLLAGEVIEITRRGKVVTRLEPPGGPAAREREAQQAIAQLQRASPGTLASRSPIREGRR